MTGARALNDRDLVVARRVGAHDQVVLGHVAQLAGVGELHALEHLRHELLRVVDELLHGSPLSWFPGHRGRARSGPLELRLLPGLAHRLEQHGDADRARVRPSRGCARPCSWPARAGRASPWWPPPPPARSRPRAAARPARPPPSAFSSSSTAGTSASSSVLSPRSVSPRCLIPSIAARMAAMTSSRAGLGRARQSRARAQEGGSPDRPRGAADALGEDDRGLLEQAAGVLVPELVPVAEDDLEAARQRVAEVPVADDRVQLAEVRLVVDRRLGDGPHDQLRLAQRRVAHTASSWGSGSVRQASRSASVTVLARARGAAVGEHLAPARPDPRGSRPRAPPRSCPRRAV